MYAPNRSRNAAPCVWSAKPFSQEVLLTGHFALMCVSSGECIVHPYEGQCLYKCLTEAIVYLVAITISGLKLVMFTVT